MQAGNNANGHEPHRAAWTADIGTTKINKFRALLAVRHTPTTKPVQQALSFRKVVLERGALERSEHWLRY